MVLKSCAERLVSDVELGQTTSAPPVHFDGVRESGSTVTPMHDGNHSVTAPNLPPGLPTPATSDVISPSSGIHQHAQPPELDVTIPGIGCSGRPHGKLDPQTLVSSLRDYIHEDSTYRASTDRNEGHGTIVQSPLPI